MAVIRDVMPVFELYQPGSIDDAIKLLDANGTDALVLAGGLDSMDWLKDRLKKPKVVVDLGTIKELKGVREAERRPRDRRHDHAHRGGAPPDGQREVQPPDGSGGARGLAADPQPGHHRRQRVAGHALLVLPRRLDLLPRRRQHLLRRHADGGEPRARDLRRRPLRRGQPVGHRAGAARARRPDGHPRTEAASASSTPRTTGSAPASTSRA